MNNPKQAAIEAMAFCPPEHIAQVAKTVDAIVNSVDGDPPQYLIAFIAFHASRVVLEMTAKEDNRAGALRNSAEILLARAQQFDPTN